MEDEESGGDTTPADVNEPVFTTEKERSNFIDRLVKAEIASEKARLRKMRERELEMLVARLRKKNDEEEVRKRNLREQQRIAKQQDFDRRRRIGYENLKKDERQRKRRKMEQRENNALKVAEILVEMANGTKPSLRL